MDAAPADLRVDMRHAPAAAPSVAPVVDAEQSDDPYAAATAEFYELLATAHWQRTGEELVGLLSGVDPADGPIVDVGGADLLVADVVGHTSGDAGDGSSGGIFYQLYGNALPNITDVFAQGNEDDSASIVRLRYRPGGASARKNRVSKRRGRPGGVTNRLT